MSQGASSVLALTLLRDTPDTPVGEHATVCMLLLLNPGEERRDFRNRRVWHRVGLWCGTKQDMEKG